MKPQGLDTDQINNLQDAIWSPLSTDSLSRGM